MKQVFLILIGLSYSMLYANEKFSSLYTNISTDCKYEKEESVPEGSDAPLTCKGPDGYTVIISYSACMEFMKVVSKNGKEVIEFPNQPIGSADKRKIEWRLLNQKPIGIIYRTSVLKETPNENCSQQKSGKENLEVRGLGKYSELSVSIPSDKKANEKARNSLDSFVKKSSTQK